MLHIVDSDSSQTLAVHEVREGRNLVIQGPPGTGKSRRSRTSSPRRSRTARRCCSSPRRWPRWRSSSGDSTHRASAMPASSCTATRRTSAPCSKELRRTWELGAPSGDEPARSTRGWPRRATGSTAMRTRLHGASAGCEFTPYQVIGQLVRLRLDGSSPTTSSSTRLRRGATTTMPSGMACCPSWSSGSKRWPARQSWLVRRRPCRGYADGGRAFHRPLRGTRQAIGRDRRAAGYPRGIGRARTGCDAGRDHADDRAGAQGHWRTGTEWFGARVGGMGRESTGNRARWWPVASATLPYAPNWPGHSPTPPGRPTPPRPGAAGRLPLCFSLEAFAASQHW